MKLNVNQLVEFLRILLLYLLCIVVHMLIHSQHTHDIKNLVLVFEIKQSWGELVEKIYDIFYKVYLLVYLIFILNFKCQKSC